MENASDLGIFVLTLAGVTLALAFAIRRFKRRFSEIEQADVVTLSEAARIVYRQAIAERMAIAGTAEYRNTPDGAVSWFERSIREVVPAKAAVNPDQITRAELKRYLRWARTVQ